MEKYNKKLLELVKKYRESTDSSKLKLISNLKEKEKESIFKLLTDDEVSRHKEIASTLIERRFKRIMDQKDILDAVTCDDIDIDYIKKNYINEDLSLTVYTIKAIINTFEGSGFSYSDGKYSRNASTYYNICKNYWDIICDRWNTDTGKLSKEQIRKKEFSQEHLDANKVSTIIRALEAKKTREVKERELRAKEEAKLLTFTWANGRTLDKLTNEQFKYYNERELALLLREGKVNRKDLFTYTDKFGVTFRCLSKHNYDYLVRRDNELTFTED